MRTFIEDEAKELMKMNYRYIIIGDEHCPTTGKRHFQIYVNFNNSISFTSIKKKLPSAHMEVTQGSPKSNQIYCSKEKVYFEDGILPHQGKVSVKDLKEMSNEQIIDMDARCHQAYIRARNLLLTDIDIEEWSKEVKVYYIQGPSGIGKTQKAKEIVRENKEKYGTKVNIVKYENNFWSGIGSAKIAIYDDFRDSHMKPSEFVNFIDYNEHRLNIKGGDSPNKYELIIITSVQKLEEIYHNVSGEPRQQWLRRIEVIDMFPKDNVDYDIDDVFV